MKRSLTIMLAVAVLTGFSLSAMAAHQAVTPKNENESHGYLDSPQQPWSKWRVHDPARPIPKKIKPAPLKVFPAPPVDAFVLFDGKNLDAWEPTKWKLVDGTIECVTGQLTSKAKFGACQIHLEWLCPANFKGSWGNNGNNGVLLQGLYEIQVFNSYEINNYPDGACGAVYGQTPPLVNACTPAGVWQSYDIFFVPAVFENGKMVKNPRVTIMQNGIMVQNNQDIYGKTTHFNLPAPCPDQTTGPLSFGGHGCPVRFRNIWVRPMN